MLIRDKLAYPGSLSASLSQELIAAYPWLAYPVAYPVAASRRCGQRLGGGRRLAGRRRLGGGGGSATAAPRSRLRLEGRWRGGRRRPAWRATARRAATRRRRLGNGGASESARRLLIVQLIVQLIPELIHAYPRSQTLSLWKYPCPSSWPFKRT